MDLAELLRVHVPTDQRHRWQVWLATTINVRPQAVSKWAASGYVPGRRIGSVCRALGDPPGLQQALLARLDQEA